MVNILKLPIRNTKYGAITKNVVFIKTEEGRWVRIKPFITETSKTGHHGVEHYVVNNHYIAVTLDISNS
jgi:hypothetical protein